MYNFKNFNKSNQNFNFFFLSLIYEKNKIFYLKKNIFYKNLQFLFLFNYKILFSLFFFLELKPLLLLDIAGFDNFFLNNLIICKKKKKNLVYIFNSLFLNSYKMFFINSDQLHTLQKFNFGASWMEREVCEFFGINFLKNLDNRNLLLEYNFYKNILLKKYSSLDFYNFNNKYMNSIKIVKKKNLYI